MSKRRLFLALWPDDVTRKQLVEVQTRCAQQGMEAPSYVSADNFHITLHFLGAVAEEDIDGLIAELNTITAQSFNLRLDRWGYFSRPKILWLAPERLPGQLQVLVTRIKSCVQRCLGDADSQKHQQDHYTPHVSLLRYAEAPENQCEFGSILWPVDRFVLVESITTKTPPEYRLLQSWSLNL